MRCRLLVIGCLLCFGMALPLQAAKLANAELALWVKAEDLGKLKDGDPVAVWPDAGGKFNDLKSVGTQPPTYAAKGQGGHPAVAFAGDIKANPKVLHNLRAPFTGEWRGMTLFIIGTELQQNNWLGTSMGEQNDLRTIGSLQLCSSKCGVPGFTFPAEQKGPQLAEISAGIDEKGVLTLTSFANGQQLATSSDPAPTYGVGMNKFIFGSYFDWMAYRGEVSEIIVYKGVLTEAERKATERYLLVKYGLAAALPNDPKQPAGYPIPTPVAAAPSVTKLTPCPNGLRIWARADDITAADHGPVGDWPNLAGDKKPLFGVPEHQPLFIPRSLSGHAVVRFQGENSNDPKRVTHYVEVPMTGSLPEFTMIFVGRHLTGAGLFDTAPNTQDTLRDLGSIQHCHTAKLNTGGAFPLLGGDGGQMGEVVVGKLGEKGQYLATYTHGFPQQRAESPDEVKPVLFKQTTLGIINRQEIAFTGDLAEVLIYDRALTTEERYQTERYLAERYDLPLKSPAQIAREPKPRSVWSLRLPQLPRTMTWIGNSESGKDNWIQHGAFTICVLPDGTVAAVSVWDEAHKELGLYKDGKALGGISGGAAMVMTDGQYFYVGTSGMGQKRAGVKRVTLDLKDAPWPKAEKGQIGFDTPNLWNEVQGLAIVNGELFVTCNDLNEVRVYDAATGEFKRRFPLDAPGRMAADKAGKLWIAGKDGAARYTTDGKAAGSAITGVSVGGLAIDNQGRLLLAENGARQQIITYDISGAQPKEVAVLGERGGVFAAARKGEMSDTRLINPNGVGVDAAGNIYVNGGWRILSYTPTGKLRWKLESTTFCLCGDFDPATDGQDLYTNSFHYVPSGAKTPGKDWTWKGYTADTHNFPEAANGGAYMIMRRLNGKLYRFTLGGQVTVARQEEGSERFIPCAMVVINEGSSGFTRLKNAPEKGAYIWTDLNGDGLAQKEEITVPKDDKRHSEWSSFLYVDSKGDIWEPQGRAGVRHLPLKGFTAQGAPIYDFAAENLMPKPADFVEVRRVIYYPEFDSMYLAGYTWNEQPHPNETWTDAGRELIRYDNWSKPTRKLISRIPFIPNNVTSFDMVPQRHLAFLGEMDTATIFVYDTNTAALLGIIEPDPDIVGTDIGWLDFPGGAVRAYLRQNGEILVTSEESYKEKQLLYRLPAGFETEGRQK